VVIQTLSNRPTRRSSDKIEYESRLKAIIDEEAKSDDEKHAGEEKGLEKGRKKGREEGIEEGLEEGIEKGEKNKVVEFIITGDNKGVETSFLAELTGYSVEEVKLIIKEHREL